MAWTTHRSGLFQQLVWSFLLRDESVFAYTALCLVQKLQLFFVVKYMFKAEVARKSRALRKVLSQKAYINSAFYFMAKRLARVRIPFNPFFYYLFPIKSYKQYSASLLSNSSPL